MHCHLLSEVLGGISDLFGYILPNDFKWQLVIVVAKAKHQYILLVRHEYALLVELVILAETSDSALAKAHVQYVETGLRSEHLRHIVHCRGSSISSITVLLGLGQILEVKTLVILLLLDIWCGFEAF